MDWIGPRSYLGMGIGMGNTLQCNVSQEFVGLRVGIWWKVPFVLVSLEVEFECLQWSVAR